MAERHERVVGRRAVLGGVAAGVSAAWLAPGAARAAPGAPVDELVALRRDLHRHPEPPGGERRTAEVVARRLRTAGLEVTTGIGGHGVVAVLTGAGPGRTVAYRADMDAVPPGDQVGGGTAPAHLCGHDVHTAAGVGVALALARRRDRLAGSVMFVFQPAEETLTGAAAMLADGVFDHYRPAEIHAVHCGPFPAGQFVVTPGAGLPGQDRGVVTLTGPDAPARAEALVAALGALSTVSRPETPEDLENLVDDMITPGGRLSRFVFVQARAAGAEVRVAVRCWPEDRHPEVRRDIVRLADASGPASVTFPNDPFPAMRCPERPGRDLARHLRRTGGPDRVRTLYGAIPFSGEDFALFLDRMPGTYTFLGVRRPRASIETSYPHFGPFDPDERAIGHAVTAMSGWLSARTREVPGSST